MPTSIRHTFYSIIQHLSLDVTLGSICSASFVVHLLGIKMPLSWWVILPLSVWLIYTADHLLDAFRLKDQAHTPRHLFHYTYFPSILGVWITGSLLALVCTYFLPFSIIQFGCIMAGLTVLHLSLVTIIGNKVSWLLHKELGVGFIYSAGVWGGPMMMFPMKIQAPIFLLFAQFFLLAMINLFIFSIYEYDTDEQDGHTSFIRAIGLSNAKIGVGIFAVLHIGLGILSLYLSAFFPYQLILHMMLLLLILTLTCDKWFGQKERYRLWGDAAFLLPVLIWLWN